MLGNPVITSNQRTCHLIRGATQTKKYTPKIDFIARSVPMVVSNRTTSGDRTFDFPSATKKTTHSQVIMTNKVRENQRAAPHCSHSNLHSQMPTKRKALMNPNQLIHHNPKIMFGAVPGAPFKPSAGLSGVVPRFHFGIVLGDGCPIQRSFR